MEKISISLMMLLVFCAITAEGSFSADAPIELNALINESKAYDGQTVLVAGEALLEPLERDGYVWVNISDGTNAIGVVMPADVTHAIHYYGDYKHIGDKLMLEAQLNRACRTHGGDLDLHLTRLISVEVGGVKAHPVSEEKVSVALASVIGMGLSVLAYRMAFKR